MGWELCDAFQQKPTFTPHVAPLEVKHSQPAMGVCLKYNNKYEYHSAQL
jgi:hypothetical protein